MPTWLQALLTIATGVLSLIGGVYVARSNLRAEREKATSAPYDALAARVVSLEASDDAKTQRIRLLEDRLDIVEDDRDVLAEAVRVVVEWEDGGRPDPPGAPRTPHRARTTLARLHSST